MNFIGKSLRKSHEKSSINNLKIVNVKKIDHYRFNDDRVNLFYWQGTTHILAANTYTVLYPLTKQTVVVAVPIEPAMTAAAAKETGFGAAFGIELGDFEAAAIAVGDKRNVMFLAHWMVDGDVVFVLDELTLSLMRVVRRFRFQWWQRDATAGHHGRAHGLEHVAADRADIELGFEHVGGAVGVDDLFAGEQLGHRHLQRLCQWLQQGDVRESAAVFPFGNGLVADAERFGELRLGQMPLLAQGANGCAGDVMVHVSFSFHH